MITIIKGLLGEDKNVITYRPKFVKITGGVLPSILFQQIFYWWGKMEEKPFYKFKEPCEHSSYKPSSSWCEELGFTKYEFDTAIKSIGIKIDKKERELIKLGKSKLKDSLVFYWNTIDRKTYYMVNEACFFKMLEKTYSDEFTKIDITDFSKLELSTYETLCNQFSNIDITNIDITETTTETTTNNKYTEVEKNSGHQVLENNFETEEKAFNENLHLEQPDVLTEKRKEKNSAKKEKKVPDSIYNDFKEVHNHLCIKHSGLAANWTNGKKNGAALKKIIEFFQSTVKSKGFEGEAIDREAFRLFLIMYSNWGAVKKKNTFLSSLDLSRISMNLQDIMATIFSLPRMEPPDNPLLGPQTEKQKENVKMVDDIIGKLAATKKV